MCSHLQWLAQSEAEVPRSRAWLSAFEQERLATMRFPKRANDFLLGRWTAKKAVGLVDGIDVEGVEIRNAQDGAPEVFFARRPAPLRISISDRAGWAVAALADTDTIDAIGCDLELVERRSERFAVDFLTGAELDKWRSADAQHRDLVANAMWSAKESALKVLRTGLRRDTRSVEVELDTGVTRLGWRGLEVFDHEAQRSFSGWWRELGRFVLTFASSEPTQVPSPMPGSRDLASATPSHSWMTGHRI